MSYQHTLKEFLNWLRQNDNSIILAMHEQADPDAVGSAIALIHIIKILNPQIEVYVFNPILSRLSKQLLLHLATEFTVYSENPEEDTLTPLIILDNPTIPEILNQADRKIILIDHHVNQEISLELLFDLRTQKVTSTAEIILQLSRIGNIPLNAISIKALLAGIIFDTRRFLYANSSLFDNVTYLMRAFPEAYNEILPLFTSTKSIAERIACIKAAQRMKRVELATFQIIFSHVSSFEAAAARSLIFLGGDLVIVVSRQSDHTRISFRASSDFITETSISLGRDIIPLLINEYGGTGGGHDGAAGYNVSINMNLKEINDFLLLTLTKFLCKEA